ncbi:MAG: hypothetical protein H6606_10925 [Flavobacteriales bacterium]|nr:hypothetical protein [Flavobacteriales bacterium]
MNWIRVISLLIIVWLTTALQKHPNTNNPENYANDRVRSDLRELKNALNSMQLLEHEVDATQFLQTYKEIRSAYKRIETYVVFRYPYLDKAINGGPVPSIETEVVVLHKSDPHGLQVIEELLVEETPELAQVNEEIEFILSRCAVLEDAFEHIPIQNWEILEAGHLALTRIMTLSLSGFDSPGFLLGLEDSRTVLASLRSDLQGFKGYAVKEFQKVDSRIGIALEKLSEPTSFVDFDFYTFFREVLIPMQSELRELHLATGFERFSEVNPSDRSIGEGAHLFAPDYLDPYYTMRGMDHTFSEKQIELGRQLFFDPVMSINYQRSCASCHKPDLAYTDGLPKSLALDFKGTVDRNAPTLINSAFQKSFFWDMRSADLNDQILHVLNSEKELDLKEEELIRRLKGSPEYVEHFNSAFPAFENAITRSTIKSALEVYIRSLTALNSRFDRNIRSEVDDFTRQEQLGFNLFMGKGACATCHFSPIFNGYVPPHYTETEGEIIGATKTAVGAEPDTDLGMYERFGRSYPDAEYIKGMFKTPTLRNIALTAPYMHNGAFRNLEEVIDFYNEGGALGRGANWPQQTLASDSLGLSTIEKQALIAFLNTLTDTVGTGQRPFKLPDLKDPKHANRPFGGAY